MEPTPVLYLLLAADFAGYFDLKPNVGDAAQPQHGAWPSLHCFGLLDGELKAAPPPIAAACGVQEVSSRVDAAFNTTGYSLVSDNEHVIFLSPALRKAVESSAAAVPHTESAAAEQAKQGKKHKAAEQPQGTQRAKQSGSGA